MFLVILRSENHSNSSKTNAIVCIRIKFFIVIFYASFIGEVMRIMSLFKTNSLDTETKSPHYFYKKCMEQEGRGCFYNGYSRVSTDDKKTTTLLQQNSVFLCNWHL